MVDRERGSSLLLVLGVTAIVAVMVAAMGAAVVERRNTVTVGMHRSTAQALADAAMARGLEGLRLDPETYSGFSRRRWGGGHHACSASRDAGPTEVKLRAEGVSGHHRVVIEARVRVSGSLPRVVEWTRKQGTVR